MSKFKRSVATKSLSVCVCLFPDKHTRRVPPEEFLYVSPADLDQLTKMNQTLHMEHV